MIRPHGGNLIDLEMSPEKAKKTTDEISEYYQIQIDTEQTQEIENIAQGVFSPLEGFLNQDEYSAVLANSRLANDIPWTIPIVLDIPESSANAVKPGDTIALIGPSGPAAIIKVGDIYELDRKTHAQSVFGTTDTAHPGVKRTMDMHEHLLGGKLELIQAQKNPYDDYYLKPQESRVLFQELGWEKIAAFQTRNPPHVGHEYVQKAALTVVDGLLINPIIGKKKVGDFKDEVILASYKALIDNYYPK